MQCGATALHFAAQYGHARVTDLLLQYRGPMAPKGVNPSAPDNVCGSNWARRQCDADLCVLSALPSHAACAAVREYCTALGSRAWTQGCGACQCSSSSSALVSRGDDARCFSVVVAVTATVTVAAAVYTYFGSPPNFARALLVQVKLLLAARCVVGAMDKVRRIHECDSGYTFSVYSHSATVTVAVHVNGNDGAHR